MALTISATDSELSKPVNAAFNQTLLRNAQKRAPYFAGTVPATLDRQRGSSTAMWRRIENLSASTTALSELTTTATYMQSRNAAALSFNNVTATAAKYGNFVIMNEEVDLFNFPGQFDKVLEVIGINAGESLNQLQRNIAEDNLTNIYAGGAASDGAVYSAIVVNNIKNAVVTLDKNSARTFTPMTMGSGNIGTVPILPAYWGLCHPDVAVDICTLSGFTSVEKYAGQTATVMGEFGTITVAGKAVRFISSEDATVDTGSGSTGTGSYETGSNADLYRTVIYGEDCIGSVGLGDRHPDGIYRSGDDLSAVDIIVKSPKSTGTSDPFNEISTVAWKAWHTGAVLNSTWGRVITSGATDITT